MNSGGDPARKGSCGARLGPDIVAVSIPGLCLYCRMGAGFEVAETPLANPSVPHLGGEAGKGSVLRPHRPENVAGSLAAVRPHCHCQYHRSPGGLNWLAIRYVYLRC